MIFHTMFKSQLQKLTSTITRPVYRWLFPTWIIIFAGLNIYINKIYVVGLLLFNYRFSIIIPYLIFTTINTILAGISINLIIMRIKELGFKSSSAGGFSLVGAFTALLTGACPGCLAGLFPAFIGLFGIPVGITSLPVLGIGLQILSTLFLMIGIYFLTKPLTCKTKD